MTKGELLKSIATEHDMKTKDCSNLEQPCHCCRKGSQEDRCVHHPRSLPHQNQEQASKDSCESFSSCCPKAADLSSVQSIALLSTLSMAQSCLWESHSVYMLESLISSS